MSEKFVLSMVIDGEVKRSKSFSRKEVKTLLQGVLYAKTKEGSANRIEVYGTIYNKVLGVFR